MPNYYKNYSYTSNPELDYNYNAYGDNESSDDSPAGNNGFYARHWNWALAQATEMFRPIAERLGAPDVLFSNTNDTFVRKPLSETSSTCARILGAPSRTFYGCTTQDGYNLGRPGVYSKPQSTTYLAQEWALEYVVNAMHHELSHQAIISTRQMLQKDHYDRIKKGLPRLTDQSLKKLMSALGEIDKMLDSQDVAKLDSSTKKIWIEKKSNVYPYLRYWVNQYIQAFK